MNKPVALLPSRWYLLHWGVVLMVMLWGAGCAVINRPTGGEIDNFPPQLDSLASSPNFQTNSRPKSLVLEFDEYIQLKSAAQNIILTPTPLSGLPKYEARARRVVIDLETVEWRDSTTYQIMFGDAVQDLNESNVARGLRFIFSTGDFLDSLQLTGQVKDALTAKPVINALVGLYRGGLDTILSSRAPEYFSRSDSSGRFVLDYLAPGRYTLAAYVDANSNYRLETGTEAVAFLNEQIRLEPGSFIPDISLRLSAEQAPLKVLRTAWVAPQLLEIQLNQPVTDSVSVFGLEPESYFRYSSADTLWLGLSSEPDSTTVIGINAMGKSDTLRLPRTLPSRSTPLRKRGDFQAVPAENAYELTFNLPLDSLNPEFIQVWADTVPVNIAASQWALSSTSPRSLRINSPVDSINYRVVLYPGAVFSRFGGLGDTLARGLVDSLSAKLNPQRSKTFGTLRIRIQSTGDSIPLAAELLDGQNKVLRRKAWNAAESLASNLEWQLKRLPGGQYSLRIVKDDNLDGQFTPGNRIRRFQPEEVQTFTLEQIRADWELETDIKLQPW